MKDKFTELLVESRHIAGLTQEAAAERICISRRALANYEAGGTPADDVMVRIIEVYDDYRIGYAYLAERTRTGQMILPDIKLMGVAAGAITLHIQMGKMAQAYDRLEAICADDVISRAEIPDYCRCMNELDNLITAAIGMKVTDIRQTQKSPVAKPRSSQKRTI
jgi:transcriptional regulator with XRE-family HTH domain